MNNIGRTIIFYAMAFLLVLAALSEARPTKDSESEEHGWRSSNLGKQNVVPISEVCPPWIMRLPGGCRRVLRFKRAAAFCPPSMPRCHKPGRTID